NGVLEALPSVAAQRARPALMVKAALITAGMVGAFFWGFAPAAVAITAGVLMLLTRRLKPERIYAELDWPLLLMFVGLFIVVAGLEHVLTGQAHALAGMLHLEHAPVLVGVTAV